MLKRFKDEYGITTVTAKVFSPTVLLSGEVSQPNHTHRMTTIAEEYFPKVLHDISVKDQKRTNQIRVAKSKVFTTTLTEPDFHYHPRTYEKFMTKKNRKIPQIGRQVLKLG